MLTALPSNPDGIIFDTSSQAGQRQLPHLSHRLLDRRVLQSAVPGMRPEGLVYPSWQTRRSPRACPSTVRPEPVEGRIYLPRTTSWGCGPTSTRRTTAWVLRSMMTRCAGPTAT
jgi:hypothetical protein